MSVSFNSKFMNEVTEVCSESQKVVAIYNDVWANGYSLPSIAYAQAFTNSIYTAENFWQEDISYFKANWNTILKNAGLAQ